MAYDLAQIGYCPKGYSGEYDIGKINTRCKGAGFDNLPEEDLTDAEKIIFERQLMIERTLGT